MKDMVKITWEHRIVCFLCTLVIAIILILNKSPIWATIAFSLLDYEINIIQVRLGMLGKDEEDEA